MLGLVYLAAYVKVGLSRTFVGKTANRTCTRMVGCLSLINHSANPHQARRLLTDGQMPLVVLQAPKCRRANVASIPRSRRLNRHARPAGFQNRCRQRGKRERKWSTDRQSRPRSRFSTFGLSGHRWVAACSCKVKAGFVSDVATCIQK